MEIIQPKMILYFVLFLIPGVFTAYLFGKINRTKPKDEKITIIHYLGFSFMAYLPWIIFLAFQYRLPFVTNFRQFIGLITAVIIMPFLFSVIYYFSTKNDWIDRFGKFIGIGIGNGYFTAWEALFAKTPVVWVSITLKSGVVIRGLYATKNSFVSTEPSERDIFLCQQCEIDSSGNWNLVKNSAGVWVNGSEISHMEFLKYGSK